MTITTAEYKAAIEAKIAAASGATSLKDLTLIKTNADLWLLNNDGGSITGYASLEALIQDYQDDLTVGSASIDLSLVGVSAFPPTAGSASNEISSATSSSWVSTITGEIEVVAIGGGGGGGGSPKVGNPAGGGGGAASIEVATRLSVKVGDVISWTIGAAGVGATGPATSTSGGTTYVRLNGAPILSSPGGTYGTVSFSGVFGPGGAAFTATPYARGPFSRVDGGAGGDGATSTTLTPGAAALPGGKTQLLSMIDPLSPIGGEEGDPGSQVGPGGGGGASTFGPGGDGGDGSATLSVVNNGADSPSYGAGGGGSSGAHTTAASAGKGGNGGAGFVRIFY
jgi:hypothetical protein